MTKVKTLNLYYLLLRILFQCVGVNEKDGCMSGIPAPNEFKDGDSMKGYLGLSSDTLCYMKCGD